MGTTPGMTTLHGSCHCGGVKFEVSETADTIRFCHCTTCKKLAGGGATANLRTPSSAIRILEGQELLQTYRPAEGSAKTFCRECGSNLFGGGWPESEFCGVRITALDDAPEVRGGVHLYVRSLAPWEQLPDDGAERFETSAR
jgi:hypothetical protein